MKILQIFWDVKLICIFTYTTTYGILKNTKKSNYNQASNVKKIKDQSIKKSKDKLISFCRPFRKSYCLLKVRNLN